MSQIVPLNQVNSAVKIPVLVEDKEIHMKFDTGAGVTVFSNKNIKSFCLAIKIDVCDTKLQAASSHTHELLGKAVVNVKGKKQKLASASKASCKLRGLMFCFPIRESNLIVYICLV